MMNLKSNRFRLLRAPAVERLTGFSVSRIYSAMAEGMFPKPIKTGDNQVAWLSPEINAWVEARLTHPNLAPDRLDYVKTVPGGKGMLRRAEVLRLTGKSTASLYKDVKQGTFPAPVSLVNNTKVFIARDVFEWIQQRLNDRNRRLQQEEVQSEQQQQLAS